MKPVVLVVEDDQGVVLFLQNYLQASYFIIPSTSLEEAYTILRSVKPDAVLLDLGLPGSDGIATLHAIREHLDPLTPIVVVTGNPNLEPEVRDKVDGFVVKGPIDFKTIGLQIETALIPAKVRQEFYEPIAKCLAEITSSAKRIKQIVDNDEKAKGKKPLPANLP